METASANRRVQSAILGGSASMFGIAALLVAVNGPKWAERFEPRKPVAVASGRQRGDAGGMGTRALFATLKGRPTLADRETQAQAAPPSPPLSIAWAPWVPIAASVLGVAGMGLASAGWVRGEGTWPHAIAGSLSTAALVVARWPQLPGAVGFTGGVLALVVLTGLLGAVAEELSALSTPSRGFPSVGR